jgi:hypothetical protein
MSMEAKISAQELRQKVASEVERLMQEVSRAISDARAGAIIADSEGPVREAMATFRQKVYEAGVQLASDKAAKAAFSPCAESGRPSGSQQGSAES